MPRPRRFVASVFLLLLLPLVDGAALAAAKLLPAHTTGDLVVGEQGACMVDYDGTPRCLGNSNRTAILSANRFAAMSIGPFDVTCGLKTDGSALCWGLSSPDPDVVAMAGPWRSLSAGGDFACGIRTDGRLQCWGNPAPAALRDLSTETYLDIAAGYGGACALRNDSTVACWTSVANTGLENAPPGRFMKVSVNDRYACGLTMDGQLACWGSDYDGRLGAPSGAGFVSVSAGLNHGCALRDTGQAVCWGSNSVGQAAPLPGLYTDVSAGANYSCGRRPDGTTVCWGNSSVYNIFLPATTMNFRAPIVRLALGGGEVCALDELGSTHCQNGIAAVRPPGGRFRTLSLSAAGGCGIARDDRLACWGTFPAGVPNGPMRAVSLGTSHACAIREDGNVQCWGDNSAGQTNAPTGVFVEIAVADAYSCGLRQDGALSCWGQSTGIPTTSVQGSYRNLTASAKRACAVKADSRAQCWGSDVASIPSGYFTNVWDAFANSDAMFCALKKPYDVLCFRTDGGPPISFWSGGSYDQLVADGATVCTIDGVRRVRCSTTQFDGPMRVSGLGEIALGAAHACNLRADGSIACHGNDAFGQTRAPAVLAKAIDASANHTCALGADHLLRCWGDDAQAASQPPATALRDFDVGQLNGCGVATNGTVACWGWNINGQGTPPTGVYRQVATGLNHSCAIRDTGGLACWGYAADGQTNAPAGNFVAVDVGERHSCAIAANGRLHCWGLNSEAQASPPQLAGDTFRALSVGAFNACAIRHNGELVCWGRNDSGQSTPPTTGKYVDVSVGSGNSCAIREDGIRVCWGSNANSQIPSFAFASSLLPGLRYGNGYSATLRVEGLSGYRPSAPTFSVVSGTLPPGLSLRSDGLLAGLPTAYGDFTFQIEARDDNGISARQVFRLDNARRTGGPMRPEPMSSPAAASRTPAIAPPETRSSRPVSPRQGNARCRGCRSR